MGIDPAMLTEAQKRLMPKAERRKLGRAGLTRAEALHIATTRLEREIHDQFSSFCLRNGIDVWHSNPTKKSSIGTGLPDFLCWKGGRAICIEFKIKGNPLSKIQESRIDTLIAHGNPVHVCVEDEPGLAYIKATGILRDYFNLEKE
jgi:hypothetical protein